MKRLALIALLSLAFISPFAIAQSMSDQEVRKQMIRESISSYSGSCPCPYNITRNGSRCGGRSAYSKPGGAEPLCYERDISDEMVKAFRERRNIK